METSPTRQTARHHSRLSAKHRSLAVLSPLPALSSRDQSRCYISLDAKPPTYKHTLAEIRYPERDKTAGNRKLKLAEKTLTLSTQTWLSPAAESYRSASPSWSGAPRPTCTAKLHDETPAKSCSSSSLPPPQRPNPMMLRFSPSFSLKQIPGT